MAHTHRTEKEEAEFKPVPEPLITLCINNCGVVATPATNNMCQNCFTAKTTSHRNRTRSTSLTSSSHRNDLVLDRTVVVIDEEMKEVKRKEVSRCSGCRKRVGLTGFRCRCGDLFCSEHRYSDRHECSYDYKSVGREAIARENPVVKAAKIVRI